MKKDKKIEAIYLRGLGQSIKEIARTLKVSKSSVSLWVREVNLTKKQKDILLHRGQSGIVSEKRRTTRLFNELNKRNLIINNSKKDIDVIPDYGLKIIGAMLYWAEGRKRGARMVGFSNSDPDMVKIMMRFFREICQVPETKFRAHIHIHSHLCVNDSLKYWSSITKIPTKQFYKTYCVPSISSKGKADSLPNGTLDISVCDVGQFLKIMGWIKGVTEKLIN
jgi:hypothetical protein